MKKLKTVLYWIFGLTILGIIFYVDHFLSELYDLQNGGFTLATLIYVGVLGALIQSYRGKKERTDPNLTNKRDFYHDIILLSLVYIGMVVVWRFTDDLWDIFGWWFIPIIIGIGFLVYWLFHKFYN